MTISPETIAKIQSFGFDVYMRNPGKDSYMLFTDGKRIGYLQEERFRGISISTVHKPNKNTGTSFQVQQHGGGLTREDLEACFTYVPSWVSSRDLHSIVKWRGIEEYQSANSFNAEYKLVEPIETGRHRDDEADLG